MKNEKEVLNQLNNLLDQLINNQLKKPGKNVCEAEITRIRWALNQTSHNSPYFRLKNNELVEVIKSLTRVIHDIDREIQTFEKVWQGVQNYQITNPQLEKIIYKNELRKSLMQMLACIRKERPEISNRIYYAEDFL